MTSEMQASPEESSTGNRLKEWAGPVLGGLALVVAITGLVTTWRTSQRVAQLEQGVTAEQGARVNPANQRPHRRRSDAKRSKAGKDRLTPEQRQDRLREEVTAHVATFALEHGLDDPTTALVLSELEARNTAVRSVFQDLAAGAVSPDQAREEVQWVRDESALALRGALGDELYEDLDRHLAARSSRRRGRTSRVARTPEGAR